MDALITLKATPAQFDIIREALATAQHTEEKNGRDPNLDPAVRRAARSKAVEFAGLLESLRA